MYAALPSATAAASRQEVTNNDARQLLLTPSGTGWAVRRHPLARAATAMAATRQPWPRLLSLRRGQAELI